MCVIMRRTNISTWRMARVSPKLFGAIATSLLATAAFIWLRNEGAHWSSAWPGQLLGILGLLLMAWAGVGYTWRKRHTATGAPPMRGAMTTHIIAGLLGPYLVILHSGFATRGAAGVGLLLMVLVVTSGVVGRVIMSAIPSRVELADPVRSAMLDARLARIETEAADLMRRGDPDAERRQELRREMASVRHEQEFQRTQWQQPTTVRLWRRVLSIWWYLHAPLSAGLWVVALAHVLGATYYATFSR
jgi:hypothetical protein